MRYWIRDNPAGSERSFTLMLDDEPACGTGEFDNAHFEFWCEIERLRRLVSLADDAFAALDRYALCKTADPSSPDVLKEGRCVDAAVANYRAVRKESEI